MKLAELLKEWVNCDIDAEVMGLAIDSRDLKSGYLFFAVSGVNHHGLSFSDQALKMGALAIVYDPSESAGFAVPENLAIAIIGLSKLLSVIAAKFYQYPSRKLAVIGITGTNGKTSCSHLLAQVLTDCSVIGTLGSGSLGQLTPTVNTTPDAISTQALLASFVDRQQKAVAMEVSSHGLEQGRVNDIEFTGGVFTNLTRDHLDYHGDMASYFASKLKLFKFPTLKFAVLNADDEYALLIKQALASDTLCWMYSVKNTKSVPERTVFAENIQFTAQGSYFQARYAKQEIQAFSPLVGAFNLENTLAVLTVLLAMGYTFTDAVQRIANLKPVIGRMERFGGQNKPTVYVDYAHTPDALQKALQTVKSQGRLTLVFGCGGNRDKGKRAQMGRVAETLADVVIITDDNPRDEKSEAIIQDILSGCKNAQNMTVINDRALAISTAISEADKADCILIAGKGHEHYQEINGIKRPFCDQHYVEQALTIWEEKYETSV